MAALGLTLAGCGGGIHAQGKTQQDTGPDQITVVSELDLNRFKPENPERFTIAQAAGRLAAAQLEVTGVVNPDVARQVPVVSLVSGRVVQVHARLGDAVRKGQLLFQVRSSDIAGAFSDYRKAVVNEELARVQLDRARLLFDNGTIAKSVLEVAENAEQTAKVDLDTTAEHLHLLGSDLTRPTGVVDILSPADGVITDQQITNSSGVQALTAPNPFTISDLSRVWVLCDVYENDLPQVRVGEYAEIRVNAYPDQVLRGRIGNISPVLDPNLRTAKVRLEVGNPGMLRLGMFVTATFQATSKERRTVVPAAAVLHLQDRDWVYRPLGNGEFQRLEVRAGETFGDNQQEILSGLKPGDEVVANALVLQNTVGQ